MSGAAPTEPDRAGARLAEARRRLGLSLEQVAEKLRLDPATIAALESGDHRAIGATVFVRGFLRRYAELVGEPVAEIEALYAQRPDAERRPDLSNTGLHRISPAAQGRRLGLLPALIVAGAIALGAVIWWAMRSKPPTAAAPAASGAPAAPPDAGNPAVPVTGKPAPGGLAEAAAGAAGAASVTPSNPVARPRRSLLLSFSDDCWVEVYDARGKRLFFGFGHAGSSQQLDGAAPFRLVLGNAPAVRLAMDGAPVELPAGEAGMRVRFTLGAGGEVAVVP